MAPDIGTIAEAGRNLSKFAAFLVRLRTRKEGWPLVIGGLLIFATNYFVGVWLAKPEVKASFDQVCQTQRVQHFTAHNPRDQEIVGAYIVISFTQATEPNRPYIFPCEELVENVAYGVHRDLKLKSPDASIDGQSQVSFVVIQDSNSTNPVQDVLLKYKGGQSRLRESGASIRNTVGSFMLKWCIPAVLILLGLYVFFFMRKGIDKDVEMVLRSPVQQSTQDSRPLASDSFRENAPQAMSDLEKQGTRPRK